jgi:hypothetical protein
MFFLINERSVNPNSTAKAELGWPSIPGLCPGIAIRFFQTQGSTPGKNPKACWRQNPFSKVIKKPSHNVENMGLSPDVFRPIPKIVISLGRTYNDRVNRILNRLELKKLGHQQQRVFE